MPLVECFASQLNQVFMNILANAIDALESELKNNPTAEKVPQITLRTEVRDDYQIVVEKHHGQIECFSEEGLGTEFVITIPVRLYSA